MEFEWDEAKNAASRAKHGIGFEEFAGWDDPPATTRDERYAYGEQRLIALGRINGRPHAMVFTIRGQRTRIISFRRAHETELRGHE